VIQHLPARYRYLGAWTLAGLYNYLRDVSADDAGVLAVFNLAHFGAWMVLGRLAIPLIRRYPVRLTLSSWALHVAMGSAFAVADVTIGHLVFYKVRGTHGHDSLWHIVELAVRSCYGLAVLTYFCMVGVVQAWDAHRLAQAREREAAAHRAALVVAQLESLKNQLQPHFLFNTLNAIAGLMHYDVASADRMLNRLSDLLRAALREAGNATITLGQELDLVEAYLDIEKIRFEGRLRADLAVPAPLRALPVPPFILQPLVENAIKHAVGPRAEGGSVQVHGTCDGDALVLEVRDDGAAGLPVRGGFGIGLANTRARLATQFGPGACLDLLREAGGTVARITLPLAALALAPAGAHGATRSGATLSAATLSAATLSAATLSGATLPATVSA
jgi:signal transduction histidine kinase